MGQRLACHSVLAQTAVLTRSGMSWLQPDRPSEAVSSMCWDLQRQNGISTCL